MENKSNTISSQDVLSQSNQINTNEVSSEQDSEKVIESVSNSVNSSLNSGLSAGMSEMYQKYLQTKREGRENFSITSYINETYRLNVRKPWEGDLFLKNFFEMIETVNDLEYVMKNVSLHGIGQYVHSGWKGRYIAGFGDSFSTAIHSLFLEFNETDNNANGYYVLKNKEAFKEFLKREAEFIEGGDYFDDNAQEMRNWNTSGLNATKILSKIDLEKNDLTDVIQSVDSGALLSKIVTIPRLHQYITEEQKEIIKEYKTKIYKKEQEEKTEYHDRVVKNFTEDFPGLKEMLGKFNRNVVKEVFETLSQEEQIKVMELEKEIFLQSLDKRMIEIEEGLNIDIKRAKMPSNNMVNKLLRKLKIKKTLPKFGKSKKEEMSRIASAKESYEMNKNNVEHLKSLIEVRELSFDDYVSLHDLWMYSSPDKINSVFKK